MPILGKETENQLTPDEIALREIEGYLDKIEHQSEFQKPQVSSFQAVSPVPSSSQTKTVKPVSQGSLVVPAKIVLPLDQKEVERGLGSGVLEGLRWLSEWCVMMIKKYPGRVFYTPPQVNR